MANQYDTNLKLQAIADAIVDSSSSGLISALEDIADAVAGGGGGGSSAAGLVSDNFSETDTYDLGDYCIHNNTLYVCINAITTPGPWDLSDWQATNAGLELSSLNSALENVCYNKIAYSNWEHTITATEASNSVFKVSDATLYPNARMIIPIGVLTNGKVLGVIRSGTSYICYGMTANASMNLYFVAIL